MSDEYTETLRGSARLTQDADRRVGVPHDDDPQQKRLDCELIGGICHVPDAERCEGEGGDEAADAVDHFAQRPAYEREQSACCEEQREHAHTPEKRHPQRDGCACVVGRVLRC